MQSSSTGNQQVLITILGVTIHKLGKNLRKKIQQGKCSMIKNDNEITIKIHKYTFNIKNKQFAQIKYPKSVSYFYMNQMYQNVVCVISIPYQENSDELINSFHSNLTNYAEVKEVGDLQNGSEVLNAIKEFYPDYLTKEVQSHGNKFTKITKQFGGLVGAINGLVNKPIQNVAQTVQNKKQQLYQKKVGGETKNKWQTIKQKASKLNNSISQTFKPVNDGVKNATTRLGNNFDNSNNKVIKAIRDFGLKTKKALNQGYKQGAGQKQIPIKLSNQSDTVLQDKKSSNIFLS